MMCECVRLGSFCPANEDLWELSSFKVFLQLLQRFKVKFMKNSEVMTLFLPLSRCLSVFLTLNNKTTGSYNQFRPNFKSSINIFSKHFTTCISFDNFLKLIHALTTRKHFVYIQKVLAITPPKLKFKVYSSSIFSFAN